MRLTHNFSLHEKRARKKVHQNFSLNLKSRGKDHNALKYNFCFQKQLKLSVTPIYVSKLNIHICRPGVFVLTENYFFSFLL